MKKDRIHENDEVLWDYLESKRDERSQELKDALLVSQALPKILQVLSLLLKKDTHKELTNDICNDVIVSLCRKLSKLKLLVSLPTNVQFTPIRNFSAYVGKTTANTYYYILRENNPHWESLRDKIRYYLETIDDLSSWEDTEKEIICGFSKWETDKVEVVHLNIEDIEDILPKALSAIKYPICDPQNLTVPELLRFIFQIANGPMKENNIRDIIGYFYDLPDEDTFYRGIEDLDDLISADYDPNRNGEQFNLEFKDLLQRYWKEIELLPPHQIKALLFPLKDEHGESSVYWLLRGGISQQSIAKALRMVNIEEVLCLALMLPMKDTELAKSMGVSVQKVINWRKAARERLMRRAVLQPKQYFTTASQRT
jgi:hypothetical protein